VPRPNFLLVGGLATAAALWFYSRTQSGSDAIGAAIDTVGNMLSNSGKEGIRDNNPGNIVRNTIAWQGLLTQAQVEAQGVKWNPKFCQFDTPANGIRAIGHILLSYQARGIATCDEIIKGPGAQGGGWSATDQDAYAANLTLAVGLDPSNGGQFVQIDVGSNLPAIATAIITQENGQQPYALSDIQNWVYT
jgi:hypothetical protein